MLPTWRVLYLLIAEEQQSILGYPTVCLFIHLHSRLWEAAPPSLSLCLLPSAWTHSAKAASNWDDNNHPCCLDDSDWFLSWSITHRALLPLPRVPWFGQPVLGSSRWPDTLGSSQSLGHPPASCSHSSPGSRQLLDWLGRSRASWFSCVVSLGGPTQAQGPKFHPRVGDSQLFNLFYWSIVDLQCCIGFRCTAKWFTYICIYLFQILLHYVLLQNSEYSSLCYTVGPCCLSMLYIAVCTR